MGFLSVNGCLVLILMTTTIPLQLVLAAAGGRRRSDAPAMYVFGDSTMDVGNNNYLPGDFPRADKPYYGVDFPGSRPTGRWSNAKALGFRRSPPAYLSLTPGTSRRVVRGIGGVSYASAGAGILDSTHAGKYTPLSKQVRNFGATRAQIVAQLGNCTANDMLSKSLFLISIGSNDIAVFATAVSHKSMSATELQSDVAALYRSLISNYTAAITELYGMGERKFGVINAAAIGCVPATRAQSPTGACAGGLNELVAGFNDALRSVLARLGSDRRSLHGGLAYAVADLYGLMQATIANPRAYEERGQRVLRRRAAGGGERLLPSCQPNATLCVDRRRYLFWDSSHPTQRAAKLIASAFYGDLARFTAPISFKQLVRSNPGTGS
ncbi:hypothetical protein ACP4OV_013643 [Aristida adscensionis]